jgi:hypothetical protein
MKKKSFHLSMSLLLIVFMTVKAQEIDNEAIRRSGGYRNKIRY